MKRSRSPPQAPFVKDYRPYTSGFMERQLMQRYMRPQRDQWDCYYRNNTVNGYKDRHYILREFTELQEAIEGCSPFSWMEAGCGVGNTCVPVLESYGKLAHWTRLLGFDISSVAVELLRTKVKKLPRAIQEKVLLTPLDPSQEDIACNRALFDPSTGIRNVSLVSLVFVLCSIATEHHCKVLQRIAACMKRPGGICFFRDYAAEDHAQQRFASRGKTPLPHTQGDAVTFERTNGTLSHFFTLEETEALFRSAGFTTVDLIIVEREVLNRKQDSQLRRRFVQGRFRLK